MSRLERPAYLPTIGQIIDQCAEIRSGWTPAERRRRGGADDAALTASWRPPQIATSQCLARVRKIVDAAI